MEREEQFINSVSYSDIARALSRDYSRIFCVNTASDVYVEFIPHEQHEELDIRRIGKDFHTITNSIKESAYIMDQDAVRTAVTKQNIQKVLMDDDSFTFNYRMLADGNPTYVKIKAARLRRDDPVHILFALGDSDAHMQRMAIYERAMRSQLTFAAVSEALTADYDCIYYVDTRTNEYIEYSSSDDFKKLGLPSAGDDFFSMCAHEFSRLVYEDDRQFFLNSFEKASLLKVMANERWSLLSFRVEIASSQADYLVKITKMNQSNSHHLVLGLTNIETNLPRIQKYEEMRKIANRDALTGVKSKHAFTVEEARINKDIQDGKSLPFGIVVCDVNGLKKINDTQGHQAGDDYLRLSCKMICDLFSHSPVYRVGGDEFAVLLLGRDYKRRYRLMRELHNLSASHIGTPEAVVSGGMSEYDPGKDKSLRDIFERADATMYKEKMLLKNLGAATRDDSPDPSARQEESLPFINIRKHLLIADDQETNREILGSLLEEDYDILYASNGIETMEMLRSRKNEIALLLLDLYMPRMNGRDVLREMQVDEDLMSIPVIMLTIDAEAELDTLKLGAMDFISKPYPDIDIVKARIAKCIELSENRDLIRHTQRDKLTGLYHFDYFLQYVARFDQQNKEASFDAFVCDIMHFHDVNELYGRQFGDLALRSIGNSFRKLTRKTGGIGCRKGADTFLLYCPHRDDYKQLIKNFTSDLFVEKETADKVKLRFGVFENASLEANIEKRFVLAKSAADQVFNNTSTPCGYYNLDSPA